MKKKILILQTGGTIGMVKSATDQALRPAPSGRDFLNLIPELAKLAKVVVQPVDNIDSSNVTPRHWEKWLGVFKKNYALFDGFVVTHGTDTMTYTASAFSFALGKTEKPVVFTGSQRPLGYIRSDATVNIINSVETAVRGPKQVTLCFGNQLLSAVRSTKFSSTDYVAFESFNSPHLAEIGVDYVPRWEAAPGGKPSWKNTFNEKVFCFKIFPGISQEILHNTIHMNACEGLVLEAYGSGNIPLITDSVIQMIQDAKKLKKTVAIVSQCPHGRVDLTKYEGGRKALNAGAVSAGDMTSEATVVKLMHGLGMKLEYNELKRYMQRNICGERT